MEKRTDFIIKQTVISAARSVSSLFEENGDEEAYSNRELIRIGKQVKQHLTTNQLENLINLCNIILYNS